MKKKANKTLVVWCAAMTLCTTLVLISAIDLAYKGIIPQTKEHVAIGILVALGYSASVVAFIFRKSF